MQVDQALHEATVAVDLEKPVTQEVKKEDKLMSIGQYARELRSSLPKDLLKPTPLRLIPFLSLVILAVVSASALVSFQLGIAAKVGLGLVIGYCFGAIAFMAHEILHGSVVRDRLLQDVFGFIGFAPFLIAPTFWRYWHNRLHHGHTQKIIKDPDAFPTQRIFKQSNYMKRMYKFTPGSGYLRSYFYFFFWFFFHNVVNQTYLRFRNRIFDELDHTRASIEGVLALLLMGSYVYFAGAENFVYAVVIPFAVMNYMLMSYISTNHNVNPLTKTNDPLVNSLTVTNNPVFEAMHFNFGYHVEHHLFPTMNPAKAKTVHKVLKDKYPERYKIMSKGDAMKLLYKTPRIYKNSTELIHPYTGETHKTI